MESKNTNTNTTTNNNVLLSIKPKLMWELLFYG